ncbi:hypothetical protein CDL15_Pgr001007 [Punica granatum]|uniref:Uncharacterized protein n=1 Tax=Punica granatum TaxID=22663 RepID=A0A218XHZ8_PUNGR|nr:hypothetical protein CDL15_Pgr001007 [Punica granatum]
MHVDSKVGKIEIIAHVAGTLSLQPNRNDKEKQAKDDSSSPSLAPSNSKAISPKEKAEEHAHKHSTKFYARGAEAGSQSSPCGLELVGSRAVSI